MLPCHSGSPLFSCMWCLQTGLSRGLRELESLLVRVRPIAGVPADPRQGRGSPRPSCYLTHGDCFMSRATFCKGLTGLCLVMEPSSSRALLGPPFPLLHRGNERQQVPFSVVCQQSDRPSRMPFTWCADEAKWAAELTVAPVCVKWAF